MMKQSQPSRVRGLKYGMAERGTSRIPRRTLHGGVD